VFLMTFTCLVYLIRSHIKFNTQRDLLELTIQTENFSPNFFQHHSNPIDIHEIQQRFYAILKNECFGGILDQGLDCFTKLKEIQDDLRAKRDASGCNQCIYSKQKRKIIINYHVFWHLNNRNDCKWRVMLLNINSFFKTQNPCCTKLMFWKLSSFLKIYEKALLEKYKLEVKTGRFEIKTFNLEDLCSKQESSFKTSQKCSSNFRNMQLAESHLISLSDMIRFFVLDIYGGIWTDGDVIYLEDMRLLWEKNFAYRWSFTNEYNTAVIGINKQFDPRISELYKKFADGNEISFRSFVPLFHPHRLRRLLEEGNIFNSTILPSYHPHLFDPAWLCHDGVQKKIFSNSNCHFGEFFQDSNTTNLKKDFYPGSFTYHIHLLYCQTASRNSYFKLFENYMNSF